MEGIIRNKDTFHSFFRPKTKKNKQTNIMVKAALGIGVAIATIGLQIYAVITGGKEFKRAKKAGDVWGL